MHHFTNDQLGLIILASCLFGAFIGAAFVTVRRELEIEKLKAAVLRKTALLRLTAIEYKGDVNDLVQPQAPPKAGAVGVVQSRKD